MSALRLGITGCGRIVEAGYLPALRGVSGLRLSAVADIDAGRRRLIASRASQGLGVRPSIHPSAGDLLDRAEVDALVVATPAGSHVGDASMASDAGIRALVEKPPAEDAPGAAALAALPSAPWIGFNRRFSSVAGLRERLPADGALKLELEMRYRRRTWRPVSVADEALSDLGPHLIDLALWLGRAQGVEVSAVELAPDRAGLRLVTTRGVAVISCATDRWHLERVTAQVGPLRLAWKQGGALPNGLDRARRRESGLVESLRAQLAAYQSAVRGGPSGALAAPADGIAAMRVVDAARESFRAGGAPVAVDMTEPVAA